MLGSKAVVLFCFEILDKPEKDKNTAHNTVLGSAVRYFGDVEQQACFRHFRTNAVVLHLFGIVKWDVK